MRVLVLSGSTRQGSFNTALAHLVSTYFAGSPEQAVTALLRMSDLDLSDAEVAGLRDRIRRARRDER